MTITHVLHTANYRRSSLSFLCIGNTLVSIDAKDANRRVSDFFVSPFLQNPKNIKVFVFEGNEEEETHEVLFMLQVLRIRPLICIKLRF